MAYIYEVLRKKDKMKGRNAMKVMNIVYSLVGLGWEERLALYGVQFVLSPFASSSACRTLQYRDLFIVLWYTTTSTIPT